MTAIVNARRLLINEWCDALGHFPETKVEEGLILTDGKSGVYLGQSSDRNDGGAELWDVCAGEDIMILDLPVADAVRTAVEIERAALVS